MTFPSKSHKQSETPAGYAIHDPAAAAGVSEHNDCSVRALVNATGRPYSEVHAIFAAAGRKDRRRFRLDKHIHDIARTLGVGLRLVRRSGTVEKLVRMFPQGTLVVRVSGHAFAVRNGVVHDSFAVSTGCHVRQAWLLVQA